MVIIRINIYDIVLIFLFVILCQPKFSENNYDIYYISTSYLLGINKFQEHRAINLFDEKYNHLVPLRTRPFIFFGNGIIPVPFVYTSAKKSDNKF